MAVSIHALNRDTRAALNRLTNAEKPIEDWEDKMEVAITKQTKQALQQKVQDMEKTSQRNNLRLVGIKKGLEVGNFYLIWTGFCTIYCSYPPGWFTNTKTDLGFWGPKQLHFQI